MSGLPKDKENVEFFSAFSLEAFDTIFTRIRQNGSVKLMIASLGVAFNYVFAGQREAIMVVFLLMMIDTITGGMRAFKKERFSSIGFYRFASKSFVYLILLATACLVDKILPVQFSSIMMIMFLSVTEAISVMENLKAMGYEVPSLLLDNLKKIRGQSSHTYSDDALPISSHH